MSNSPDVEKPMIAPEFEEFKQDDLPLAETCDHSASYWQAQADESLARYKLRNSRRTTASIERYGDVFMEIGSYLRDVGNLIICVAAVFLIIVWVRHLNERLLALEISTGKEINTDD